MYKAIDVEDRLNSILTRFVDSKGNVDYRSLAEEQTVGNYVRWLSGFDLKNLKTRN